ARIMVSLPEEAPRARGIAAVTPVRADDDEGLPGAAACDADGVFRPLDAASDERPLEDGLHYLSREHGGLGCWAVQLETPARLRILDGRRLHVVQELRLAGTPGESKPYRCAHEAGPSRHFGPPVGGCAAMKNAAQFTPAPRRAFRRGRSGERRA